MMGSECESSTSAGPSITSNSRQYKANQTAVPYILDEFSQMWETPFSPTDRNLPCAAQRPPGLSQNGAETRLYMANHNLNVDVTLLGVSVLMPNTVYLNQTNNITG